MGIKSLRDLKDFPESKLVAHFGIQGHHLYQMGQLEGSWKEDFADEGKEDQEALKSMGHAYTLPVASADAKIALQVLFKLSEMVGRRLREAKLSGNTVHFILTDRKNEYFNKQKKLGRYIQDGREIFLEAAKILKNSEHYKRTLS